MGNIPQSNHPLIDTEYKAQRDKINHAIVETGFKSTRSQKSTSVTFTGGSHKNSYCNKNETDASIMAGQNFRGEKYF